MKFHHITIGSVNGAPPRSITLPGLRVHLITSAGVIDFIPG